MTSRQIIARVARALRIDTPADANFTINSVNNFSTVLTTSAGTTDQWAGGLIVVTSGDAEHDRVPIASNSGNAVIAFTPFDLELKPQAGATCKLTGGPLAEAMVTQFELDVVTAYKDSGYSLFVNVDYYTSTMHQKALGKDRTTRGGAQVDRTWDILVTCEQTETARPTTAIAAYEYNIKLDTLVEQVEALIYNMRLTNSTGLRPVGDIEVGDKTVWRRDGAPASRVRPIFFSVACRK